MFGCGYCQRPLRNDASFCDGCGHFLGPLEAHTASSNFQSPRAYAYYNPFIETGLQTIQMLAREPQVTWQSIQNAWVVVSQFSNNVSVPLTLFRLYQVWKGRNTRCMYCGNWIPVESPFCLVCRRQRK